MNIEKKILQYLYDFFPEFKIFPNGALPLEKIGLNTQQDQLDYYKVFDDLVRNFYIERDGGHITLTLYGVFYYEKKYLNQNYYFLKAVKIILEFLEILENGEYPNNSLPNAEIIEELGKNGISMNNQEFYQFLVTLEQKMDFFKNIGPFGIQTQNEIVSYGHNRPILTPRGRDSLKELQLEIELFKTITDPIKKNILQKEYNKLLNFIQQGYWKDACVTIGGILEYILTIWFQGKGITPSQISNNPQKNKWKDINFHKMIEFYMNNSANFLNEIGTYTDWNLVKTILKDYRNYVHLAKYEARIQKGDFLSKHEFDRIYPVFIDILKKF